MSNIPVTREGYEDMFRLHLHKEVVAFYSAIGNCCKKDDLSQETKDIIEQIEGSKKMEKGKKNKDKVYFERTLNSKNKIIGLLQEQVTLIKSKLLDDTIEDLEEYTENQLKLVRLDREILEIEEQLREKDAELGIY
ncbi:hypothetical protein ES705_20252 [subsurface metagenome]